MQWLPTLETLVTSLGTHQQMLAIYSLVALFLVLQDRRLQVLTLIGQYAVIGTIKGMLLLRPYIWVEWGIGLTVSLVLFLSASYLEHAISSRDTRQRPASMGPGFGLAVFSLSTIAARGLGNTQALDGLSNHVGELAYFLMFVGLASVAMLLNPLRRGIGSLIFLNGFGLLYISMEQGFFVHTLLGTVHIVLALAIAVSASVSVSSQHHGDGADHR